MSKAARARKKRRAEKRSKYTDKSRLSDKLERALDLPEGSLRGAVRIELTGNLRAVIDGYCGILEYSGEVIRLSTDSGIVRFAGSELTMGSLNDDSAIVQGRILAVEFLG